MNPACLKGAMRVGKSFILSGPESTERAQQTPHNYSLRNNMYACACTRTKSYKASSIIIELSMPETLADNCVVDHPTIAKFGGSQHAAFEHAVGSPFSPFTCTRNAV